MRRIDIAFTNRFIEEALQIYSPKVQKELDSMLETLQVLPEIGSRIVADSVKREFGDDVYKCLIGPFAMIYRYNKEENLVKIIALLHQRGIR